MNRIKTGPFYFWSYVFKSSFVALFKAKETADSLRSFLWKWGLAIIAGFGAVTTLGWSGWLNWAGNNTLTYGHVLISALLLRFFSNVFTITPNLYFELRRTSDRQSWEDVSSSVWREPQDHPLLVGVRLERDEPYSVQNLRAILISVVRDGEIHFKGDAESILPIRKPDGLIAWRKSFSNDKPRNILLASASADKIQVKVNIRQVEKVLEFDPGKYDVEIQFTADGGVNGHSFRGILIFDGKSLELKKLR